MSRLKTNKARATFSPNFDIYGLSAFQRGAKRVCQSKIVAVRAWKAPKSRDFQGESMFFESRFLPENSV